jgi:hypothetical protein
MIDLIISATDVALKAVAVPRFLRTERGFQGQFYCALQKALEQRGVLENGHILEMEYQKSARHGMYQRPDIVLHIPAEEASAEVYENNLAVWALKRHATEDAARDDFNKLDEMIERLRYSLGIFVNVDSTDHFAPSYVGAFPDGVRTVAVSVEDLKIVSRWGHPGDLRRS